jgi:glycosyltransferase involved in cell wall biosynthesis
MHLIIQIPCYNEEHSLPATLADIPVSIPGIDAIETLVIDDGSSDHTVEVAQRLGVKHILHLPGHKGLAVAFQAGLDACLRLEADIIVNTDGDNQYPQADIPRLIAPILHNQADIVIGDRQVQTVAHFSPLKKRLQQWGSWVVYLASGVRAPDATSGFRAYSREAALRLSLLTRYTYTLETIIQAGKKGLRITYVPVQVNQPTRDSRLVKSNWSYVKQSAATILRLYAFYEPLRTFSYISLPFVAVGLFALMRFLYFYFTGQAGVGRHVQSLVVGGTLLTLGFLLFILGVIADLIAANRMLIEETMYRVKRMEVARSDSNRLDSSGLPDKQGIPPAIAPLPGPQLARQPIGRQQSEALSQDSTQ